MRAKLAFFAGLLAVALAAPPAGGMIRHIFIFEPPVSLDEFDIWYFRVHSQECMKLFGPWLRRYETYRSIPVPAAEASRFNVYKGRYTELWYDSVEAWREAAPYSRPYARPPWTGGMLSSREKPQATIIIPARPTEDFLRKEPTPSQRPFFRWIFVLRYPVGVSVEEGEKWYLNVHTQEAKAMPGLLRYISYKAIPDSPAPTQWVRMSELWFKDYDAFHTATTESGIRYTAPSWAKPGESWIPTVAVMVGYEPDMDFLRERPRLMP